MATRPSSPKQATSLAINSTTLLRRRDKRRHSANTAQLSFHWNDLLAVGPAELVALAVRFDERRGDESLLMQPLETGRLYDNHQEFLTALHYLREQQTTKPQPSRLSKKARSCFTKSQKNDPPYALTPIILSGLLTAIEEQRDNNNEGLSDLDTLLVSEDRTSELVQACQAMRQAARARVRKRRKRRRIQRIALPLFGLAILAAAHWRTMAVQRHVLQQWDYVQSSCDTMPAYAPACRLAEARLWFTYNNNNNNRLYGLRQFLFFQQQRDRATKHDRGGLLQQQRYYFNKGAAAAAPFAMHTTLSQDVITWNELNEGYRPKRAPKAKATAMHSNDNNKNNFRWLGETTVNRLVREAIETHLPSTLDRRILDVGCGVGGTLYALLPPPVNNNNNNNDDDDDTRRHHPILSSYQGVTASAAEIHVARRLLDSAHRSFDTTKEYTLYQYDAAFAQQNFDQQFPGNNYTVAVAIESLSHSRNLENTVDNIVKALVPGGILVIVDDVTYPDVVVPDVETAFRPSLVPHTAWVAALQAANCEIVSARDLSLEYQVVMGDNNNDNDSNSFLPHHRFSWVRLFSLSVLGAPWERYLSSTGNAASQRWIELQEEQSQLLDLWKRRRFGYGEGSSLSYNMYVCVKSSSSL